MVIQPGTKADINKMVMTWLPYFAFIMYLINRGTPTERSGSGSVYRQTM